MQGDPRAEEKGDVSLALFCLLFLLIAAPAHGQTRERCVAGGERVPTVYDTHVRNPAVAEDGEIIINPARMRSFSPVHQKFIYWHECGHVVLGHSGTTPRQERDADCYAARVLSTRERLTEYEIKQLLQEISGLRGDWAHLPGPARADHLKRCGLGSATESRPRQYRPY